jgi:hypothetical protein
MEETMGDENKRGLASMNLSCEKEKEILLRCFKMVDYLNNMATDIIIEFISKTSCPMAKQILRNSPEVLTVRAFERAINDLNKAFRISDDYINCD